MNYTEERIQGIVQAMAAIQDRAVIEAKGAVVQVIAQLLRSLLEGIADLDREIEEVAGAHPEFFIFQSLPRAGAALSRFLRLPITDRDHAGMLIALLTNADRNQPGMVIAITPES